MNNLGQKACKILKNFKLLNVIPDYPEQGRETQFDPPPVNTMLELTSFRGITETGAHAFYMVKTESLS